MADLVSEVAELLDLLGHDTKRHAAIGAYEVDLIAEFSAGVVQIRLAIECKDLTESVSASDVERFAGVAGLLKSRGAIDKAMIVSRTPFTHAATNAGKERAIDLVTLERLSANIIDFTRHLRWLETQFEDSDLARAFIAPRLRDSHGAESDALRYLTNWLSVPAIPHLFIHGEPGGGKTALCKHFAYSLAREQTEDSTGRIPVLIPMREFARTANLRREIVSYLVEEHGVYLSGFAAFEHMLNRGRMVLILDGLDEATPAEASHSTLKLISEIAQLAGPDSKIVVTARSTYVAALLQSRTLLSSGHTTRYLHLASGAEFEPIQLLPWNLEQATSYLMRSAEGRGTNYLALLQSPAFEHYKSTPLLLQLMMRSLAGREFFSGSSDRELFSAAIDAILQREVAKRSTSLDLDTIRRLIQEIGRDMKERGISEVSLDDIEAVIARSGMFADEIEARDAAIEITQLPLLSRIGMKEFSFVHNSFAEFFS